MSALVSPNYLTIELDNLDAQDYSHYSIITFPSRTRITSICFTVNEQTAGEYVDDRVWKLYAVVGVPAPTEESPWNENTFPLFGANEKPVVTRTNRYVSNVLVNTPVIEAIPTQPPMTISVDLGILDPGSYLTVWVQHDSGDVDDILWEATAATVTVGYEDTVAPTIAELVAEYPFLD